MARRGKRVWRQPRKVSLLGAPERTRARRERINLRSANDQSAHPLVVSGSGLMFWFIRKKLVGSYLFLSASSRA